MPKITPFGLLFIALTIAFTVAGQLAVKKGMLQVGSSPTEIGALPRFVVRAFTNPFVVIGLVCAVAAALTWVVAVSRADLSVAYPFLALATVLVLVFSGLVFGEAVPVQRWIGVLVVVLGLIIATR